MAELLIKLIDHVSNNPIKNQRDAFKAGFIICVCEDGKIWGNREHKAQWLRGGNLAKDWHGRTFVLKIPKVSPTRFQPLLEMQTEKNDGSLDLDMTSIPGEVIERMNRVRRWRLDLSLIPLAARNEIRETGELTVTPKQFKNALRRMRDQAVYADVSNGAD